MPSDYFPLEEHQALLFQFYALMLVGKTATYEKTAYDVPIYFIYSCFVRTF